MIEIETGTAYNPVQNEHVKRVEQSTSVPFPESYLGFMEISNGGVPVRPVLNIGERTITIEKFLHLIADYKTNNDLGIYDIGVMHSQFFYVLGDYVAPFASLRGGNFLCFDCNGCDEAKVIIWDSELSIEDTPVHYHVADNFDEFVEIYQKHSS